MTSWIYVSNVIDERAKFYLIKLWTTKDCKITAIKKPLFIRMKSRWHGGFVNLASRSDVSLVNFKTLHCLFWEYASLSATKNVRLLVDSKHALPWHSEYTRSTSYAMSGSYNGEISPPPPHFYLWISVLLSPLTSAYIPEAAFLMICSFSNMTLRQAPFGNQSKNT